jgi:hypothetical protein
VLLSCCNGLSALIRKKGFRGGVGQSLFHSLPPPPPPWLNPYSTQEYPEVLLSCFSGRLISCHTKEGVPPRGGFDSNT